MKKRTTPTTIAKKIDVVIAKGEQADAFYKRNPSVAKIARQGNAIILKMKDGSTEKYDTGKKER